MSKDDKEISSVTTITVFTDGSSKTEIDDKGDPDAEPMCSVVPNPSGPPEDC